VKSARLPQHRGGLSCSQIAAGMNVALANAHRLWSDAALLAEHGRTPSAVALAILSIEESGKVPLLRQLALATDDPERREFWKAYRNHRQKNTLWIFGQLVAKGGRTLEDLRRIVDPDSDHPDTLDNLKQLCLYTDCFIDGKWSSPNDLAISEIAPYLLTMAEVLSQAREVTSLEVELWQKHLLPVKGGTFEASKRAVADWYAELQLRGLATVATEELDAFLGHESSPPQA
jgi:AbiV family abortive infection protein